MDTSFPSRPDAVATVASPKFVSLAVTLLWISWGLSFIGVVVNYFLFPAQYVNRTIVVVVVLLALQGIVIYYIGRGSNAARWLAVVVLVVGLPGLVFLFRVITDQSLLAAAISAMQFLLKVVAITLLFTRASSAWFRQVASQRAGL